ncbi:hypothetical protein UA08_01904 [Talaromyces atroroseus]|uniref:Pre-mRNA-splicing factor 38B n=1 Tax=Talaromyces atroroseus TaxID=1441469 RepID=A0A1Q5QA29_TALAT|nr:hypothetical protein UA08_01904 [Talaromyces atroroseus]OKL62629.1 hypothetical protein UA08_01904 [Talaromyces atroroseus]
MTLGEPIDDPTSNDDYVAQLLASEAKDKSIKYSALGLQAYLPRRPTDRAPKPNTRFLKNILRDTDSHNAALRRREEQEARERMRKLRRERSPPSNRSEHRERHRENERSYRHRSPHHREKERSSKRKQSDNFSDRDYKSRSSRRPRRRYEDDESVSEYDRERSSRSHRRYCSDERRSARARDSSKLRNQSSGHFRGDRDGSPSHSRSRSPEVSRRRRDDSNHYERRKPATDHSQAENNQHLESERDSYPSDGESDPLEDFVGPLPASSHRSEREPRVPTRGRGSYRLNSSTIDSHFARDYDPKLDVDISENEEGSSSKRSTRRPVAGLMTEDDDWDMALEALRDRANWRQKGEERLRAAGFDDNTVQRWKQDPAFTARGGNDTEGRIEDVTWAKKGEGREWDRGKVMNDDGQYDVKAQW